MTSMINELNSAYEKWGNFKFKYDMARIDDENYDVNDIIYYAKKFNYYKARYSTIREVLVLLGLTVEWDSETLRWVAHN